MLDRNLLQALSTRQKFNLLASSVPKEAFDRNTVMMLKLFSKYFKTYLDAERINYDELTTMVKLSANMSEEQNRAFDLLIKQLEKPVDDATIQATIAQLEELRFEGKASILLQQYKEGAEIDLRYELAKLAEESSKRSAASDEGAWDNTPISQLVDMGIDKKHGFTWDFLPPSFNDNNRGAVYGDNICLAAPTDAGKTGLLLRWAENWTKQFKTKLEQGIEKEFRPLLILINEGTTQLIIPRLYQTVLRIGRQDLIDLRTQEVLTKQDGLILKKYNGVVGRFDAIRMVNIHGMSVAQVKRIIEKHNPFCVMTDMTGRIRSTEGLGANDTNQLEEVWNCLREFAAILNFIHVGTIQVSNEGMNMLFPPITALQNTKVGVQTTLDFCIMMGAFLNATDALQNVRGLSTVKNKLVNNTPDARKYIKEQVQVDFIRNIWNGAE